MFATATRLRRLFRPPRPAATPRPARPAAAPAPPPGPCPCGGRCGYGFGRPAAEHVFGKPPCLQD